MPVVPLDSKYTLDSQPPAECASRVTGAPSVWVLTEFTASSMHFRYLQSHAILVLDVSSQEANLTL